MARSFVIVLLCQFAHSFALQCIKSEKIIGDNLQLLLPELQEKAEGIRVRRSGSPGDYLETCKTGDVCGTKIYVHSASNGYASYVKRGCHTVPKIDHDKCVCKEGDRHDPKKNVIEKNCFCASAKCSNPAQKYVDNMHKPSDGPGLNDVCSSTENEAATIVPLHVESAEREIIGTSAYFVYGNGATGHTEAYDVETTTEEPFAETTTWNSRDDEDSTTEASVTEGKTDRRAYFPWTTPRYKYDTIPPKRKSVTVKTVNPYGHEATSVNYRNWQDEETTTVGSVPETTSKSAYSEDYGDYEDSVVLEDSEDLTTEADMVGETDGNTYFPWNTPKYNHATVPPTRKPVTVKKPVYPFGELTTAGYGIWNTEEETTTAFYEGDEELGTDGDEPVGDGSDDSELTSAKLVIEPTTPHYYGSEDKVPEATQQGIQASATMTNISYP